MYRVGDVIWYLSDDVEAAGKKYGKGKYILCVAVSERWYFFINSSGRFADSFRITHADFGELPQSESFIGCGRLLTLSDDHLEKRKARKLGTLPREILRRLIDHVNDAEALRESEKDVIIDALAAVVSKR